MLDIPAVCPERRILLSLGEGIKPLYRFAFMVEFKHIVGRDNQKIQNMRRIDEGICDLSFRQTRRKNEYSRSNKQYEEK